MFVQCQLYLVWLYMGGFGVMVDNDSAANGMAFDTCGTGRGYALPVKWPLDYETSQLRYCNQVRLGGEILLQMRRNRIMRLLMQALGLLPL